MYLQLYYTLYAPTLRGFITKKPTHPLSEELESYITTAGRIAVANIASLPIVRTVILI